MQKLLDNYCYINNRMFRFVAERCNEWAENEEHDIAIVMQSILDAFSEKDVMKPGDTPYIDFENEKWHLFGNMFGNPGHSTSGALWPTSRVLKIEGDVALTVSGSQYRLVDPWSGFGDEGDWICFGSLTPANALCSISVSDVLPDDLTAEVFADPLSFVDRLGL